jgi:hypothetical protein
MTITAALGEPVGQTCVEERLLGWSICRGRSEGPVLGWVGHHGCLRVLLGEPMSEDTPLFPRSRLLRMALTALAEQVSASDTVARLVAGDASRDLDPVPRFGLVIIDLFEDGHAEVACRYSPSVLYLGRSDQVALLPKIPGTDSAVADLAPGDRIVAYSGSFLGSLPPETVSDVPALLRDQADAAVAWRQLVARRDDSAADQPPPLDLLIITREG